MIRRRFEALQSRIDALSLRERAIIFIALSAFIYLVWNTLLINPLERDNKSMQSQLQRIRDDIAALDDQIAAVMNQQSIDPNKTERDQLIKLDRQLQQANDNISKMITGLIAPEEMAKILEQVLHRQHIHHLRILS